jgi:hypothetical protein
MRRRFASLKPKYGQRWQAETVNSMIKRRLGSALRARSEPSQAREIVLRAITHNVMIVRLRVFYRATQDAKEYTQLHADAEALREDLERCRVPLPAQGVGFYPVTDGRSRSGSSGQTCRRPPRIRLRTLARRSIVA